MRFLLPTYFLVFSFLCFGDGFNYKKLETPPSSIDKFDWQDGSDDLGWVPHVIVRLDFSDDSFKCFPRIVKVKGKYKSQILIQTTKGTPQYITFKYRSNRLFTVKIRTSGKSSNSNLPENEKVEYYAVCDVDMKEYISNFVKEIPTHLIIDISGKTLELKFPPEWIESFNQMKPLFLIDSK